jgi:putative ABC transport system substrate-binding protein
MESNGSVQRKRIMALIALILIVAGSLFLSGCGTEQPRVYQVGILSGIPPFAPIADGFKAEMTELGYVEGENIVYDVQETNADPDEQRRVLEQFVADEVDLIFAFATEAAIDAKAATEGTDIPVVFAMANLEGIDLVENMRQPGGNITGVRYPGPDLAIKRFEFLMEIAPQTERLYVAYRGAYPANHSALEVLRPVAEAAGVTLVEVPLTSAADLEADLQARAAADDIGIDAILIMPDDITQSPPGWPMLSEFAAEHKIPIGGSASFEADTGAVFSYINENVETGRLAAPLADKIFNGTPAGDIPVVTPESELRLNYKLAQELGLTVPESLVSLAVEVIR